MSRSVSSPRGRCTNGQGSYPASLRARQASIPLASYHRSAFLNTCPKLQWKSGLPGCKTTTWLRQRNPCFKQLLFTPDTTTEIKCVKVICINSQHFSVSHFSLIQLTLVTQCKRCAAAAPLDSLVISRWKTSLRQLANFHKQLIAYCKSF